MPDHGGYGQFCPVAMAAATLCSRWTVLVLRELLAGTTRFNDIRRGVPRMSPALLSRRLKGFERAGVVSAIPKARGVVEYHLVEAGDGLRTLVLGMGFGGQRCLESQLSHRNLDPSLLIWDMRRGLRPEPLPPRRCTIQFQYPALPESRRDWWLVVDFGVVELCGVDPGFEVDLFVVGPLRSMTAVWMGIATLGREAEAGRIELHGDPAIARSMRQWLGLSPFATEPRRVS